MSYSSRQTQSKAQTESNAKILRALVKQPDNKVCADCKRNDPRWASWNIGCFLCIRCSGIHRSMGTHISRVKSIDLDIWTPEQMVAIQKWGNKRANAYWEAHLKAGHVPPDHKVESFIRSKYELRRWAKEGAVPSDPSVLDDGASGAAASPAVTASSSSAAAAAKAAKAAPTSALDLLGGDPAPSAATTSVSSPNNSLLDDFSAPVASNGSRISTTNRQTSGTAPTATASTAAAKPAAGGGGGLFDLDWHDGPVASPSTTSPTSPSLAGASKGKNDILSLFAASKPLSPSASHVSSPPSNLGGLDASFGGLSMAGNATATAASSASNPWSSGQSTTANASMGSNNFGTSDPWASGTNSGATASNGNDIWGNMTSGTKSSSVSNTSTSAGGKNDAFADIWSDFK